MLKLCLKLKNFLAFFRIISRSTNIDNEVKGQSNECNNNNLRRVKDSDRFLFQRCDCFHNVPDLYCK